MDNVLTARISQYEPLNELEQLLKYMFIHDISCKDIDFNSRAIQHIVKAEKGLTYEETVRKFKTLIRGINDENTGVVASELFIPEGRSIYIRKFPRYLSAATHRHKDVMEINIVLQGEFFQRINGTTLKLTAGDICFIAPNVIHGTRAYDDKTVALSVLVYEKELRRLLEHIKSDDKEEHAGGCQNELQTFLSKILYGGNYHPFLMYGVGFDVDIANIVMDLESNQNNPGPYTDRYMIAGLHMFILQILIKHSDKIVLGGDIAKNDEDILNLLDYIKANVDHVTLDSLAKTYNYSPSYLSVRIKKQYGRSFKDIITDFKLEQAITLLMETDYNMSKIADIIGYSDKSYFLRRFKSIYGMTPTEYRILHSDQTVTAD